MKAKIYHNPRCSKSRATLALLAEHGLDIEVIHYLETPPTAVEIRQLLELLELDPAALVRQGEPAFRASGLDLRSPAEDLIALLAREPSVLERPIVVIGGAARIGRPPERVLELLA